MFRSNHLVKFNSIKFNLINYLILLSSTILLITLSPPKILFVLFIINFIAKIINSIEFTYLIIILIIILLNLNFSSFKSKQISIIKIKFNQNYI